jgi:hypothetical protein
MLIYAYTVNGCQVDEEDFNYLKRFKWYTNSRGYSFFYKKGFGKTTYRVYMHWVVMHLHGVQIPRGSEVDHIDRVKTNNHFWNLRVVTHKINLTNKAKVLLTEEEAENDRITILMRRDGKTEEEIKEALQ